MIKIKTLSKDNFASKAIKYILYSIINILAYIPMLCVFKYNQTLVHPITTRGASNISPVSHPQLAMPPWAGPRGSLALLTISASGQWLATGIGGADGACKWLNKEISGVRGTRHLALVLWGPQGKSPPCGQPLDVMFIAIFTGYGLPATLMPHGSSWVLQVPVISHPDETLPIAKSSRRLREQLSFICHPDDLLHWQWVYWLMHMILGLARTLDLHITGPLWGNPPIMRLFDTDAGLSLDWTSCWSINQGAVEFRCCGAPVMSL